MATSEILIFAEGPGANLEPQATYAADPLRISGNVPGIAKSAINNKALLQSSLMAATLAKFMADNQANNIVDTATVAQLVTWLGDALRGGLGITPPQFDNDTSIATAAFVQRALGNFSGVVLLTVTTTLTAADVGKSIVAGGPSVLTLPAANTVAPGACIHVYVNVGAVTVQRAGSDVVQGYTPSSTSIPLGVGDTITLRSNGVGSWFVVAGSMSLVASAVMAGANWTTPPQFDVAKKLATAEFVQRALGNYRYAAGYTSAITLTAADIGSVIYAGGSTTFTIGLPAGIPPVGSAITIVNFASVPITVSTPTGVIVSPSGATATAIIGPGSSMQFVLSDGVGNWWALGGTAGLSVGQTWQDVTGSRAANTIYTNGTGKPIQLSILSRTSSSASASSMSLEISGITVVSDSTAAHIGTYSLSHVVPLGATYRLVHGANMVISRWAELR